MNVRARIAPLIIATAAATVFALAGTVAHAQAIDDPEAAINLANIEAPTTVDEIVVTAQGPGWWRITAPAGGKGALRAGTRVYLFAIPWAYPGEIFWSSRDFERALTQADTLIVPPVLTEFQNSLRPSDLPDIGPIPADLVGPISAAAQALGQPPQRYLSQHPLLAGYILAADYRASIGLRNEAVLADVLRLNRARGGGPTFNASSRRQPSARETFAGLTAAGGRECLEGVLQEIAAGKDAAERAARGWRGGAVETALSAPRGQEQCGFAAPALAALRRTTTTDTVNAISAAELLAPNGLGSSVGVYKLGRRRVAVVYLRSLVAEGGVLDQLRAQGFVIEGPMALPQRMF